MELTVTKLRNLDQLIEVASRVLVEKGAENLSLDDIAIELGMHRSSLYYYVANKAELLGLVEYHRLATIVEEIRSITLSEQPAREKLSEALRAHLRHLDRFFPESKAWNRFQPIADTRGVIPKDGPQLGSDIVGCFRTIIEQGMASGEFSRVGEPKLLAYAILGMCNWLPRWYRKGERLSIDEIADNFLGLIAAGLLPNTNSAALTDERESVEGVR